MSAEETAAESASIRVVAGSPDDDEIAAVVAVLTALGTAAPEAARRETRRPSAWLRSTRGLRSWQHDSRWS